MKALRDFYEGLPPRDRAVVWVAIALGAAIGFGSVLIAGAWSRPAAQLAPSFNAPPSWVRFAVAMP
jgi:hypothetical protein